MPGPLHTALGHGRHPLTGALARPPPLLQVRDFSMIFDAYSQFEESLISALIERQAQQQARAELEARQAGAADGKGASSAATAAAGTQLELDMRLERLERLMERRPELLSSVLLRQNPHSVHEWLKRAGLFESEPAKAIQTYAAAVKTVDPQKAVGKPAALWLAFARFYEQHGDLKNARVILRKAAAVPYRSVEELASVWQVRGGRWPSGCGAPRSQRQIGEPRTRASGDARRGLRMQGGCSSGHLTLSPAFGHPLTQTPAYLSVRGGQHWTHHQPTPPLCSLACQGWAEMELRNKKHAEALAVLAEATVIPPASKRAKEKDAPVQDRLYKFTRLWAFYADLQASLPRRGRALRPHARAKHTNGTGLGELGPPA